MAVGFLLLVGLIVLGVAGLGMLVAAALMLLRDTQERKHLVLGIVLLVLGLLFVGALVAAVLVFFLPMNMY